MRTGRLFLYHLLMNGIPETRFFGWKSSLLRWCGATVGRNVRVNSSARFAGTGKLVIGDDVWIGAQVFISSVAEVRIGSCIDIAPRVTIVTGTHELDPTGPHVAGRGYSLPVTVGDGCWLGAGSLILPGVTLGDHVAVAAGSVVTRDVPGHTLIAGVPAVVKRSWEGVNSAEEATVQASVAEISGVETSGAEISQKSDVYTDPT